MCRRSTHLKKFAVAATAVVSLAACSSTDPAPFHMYSSPLLEGEMQTPATDTDERSEASTPRPGVESRQVYAYQRWSPDPISASPIQPARTARSSGQRPTFDTVTPPSEPVLADDAAAPTGDGGQTTGGNAPGTESASTARSAPDKPNGRTADTGGNDATSPTTQPADEDDSSLRGRDRSALAAAYIHALLTVNDIDLGEKTADSIPRLYRSCRSEGEAFHSGPPHIGDLVFFHNTYDANNDGRNNDWYTLVGIVEEVRTDGTVEFLAYRDGGVEQLQMNTEHLDRQHAADNSSLNSQLRDTHPDDPPFTQYLAGQLFAGYCDVFGDQNELILIDEWSP